MFINFCRTTILVALLSLCSCDKLKGPESRELAGGYRLKRVRGSTGLALIIPNHSGGLIVDEMGWWQPIIVARRNGSEYWEVINTERAERKMVSDNDLKSDSAYNSIHTMTAETAWNSLKEDTRIW
jgi:hypothetical protein